MLDCVFASWGNMACRGKWSEDKEYDCSGGPEKPEALLPPLPVRPLMWSNPSLLLTLLTWVLLPLQQPLVWQKRYRFCIYYLRFLVKFTSLYDRIFLLLLSFCSHLVWMLLRVGAALVFWLFNKYKLNIYQELITRGRKWISSCLFLHLFSCSLFIQSTNMYWTPPLCYPLL